MPKILCDSPANVDVVVVTPDNVISSSEVANKEGRELATFLWENGMGEQVSSLFMQLAYYFNMRKINDKPVFTMPDKDIANLKVALKQIVE